MALVAFITTLPAILGGLKGLFGAAETVDTPLNATQIQAAKATQAAIKQAGSPATEYDADRATFISNVIFPGFNSVCNLAISGGTKNAVMGALFPLISQAQQFGTSHHINENVPMPDPHTAKGSVDVALATAYQFAESLCK